LRRAAGCDCNCRPAVSRDEYLVARVLHYLANLLLQRPLIFDE